MVYLLRLRYYLFWDYFELKSVLVTCKKEQEKVLIYQT